MIFFFLLGSKTRQPRMPAEVQDESACPNCNFSSSRNTAVVKNLHVLSFLLLSGLAVLALVCLPVARRLKREGAGGVAFTMSRTPEDSFVVVVARPMILSAARVEMVSPEQRQVRRRLRRALGESAAPAEPPVLAGQVGPSYIMESLETLLLKDTEAAIMSLLRVGGDIVFLTPTLFVFSLYSFCLRDVTPYRFC